MTDLEVGQRVACKIRHAAHAIVEAGRCIPIPDGVSNQDASIYRLISIVMQGIHKAQVQLGWEVAVLGLGSIGNLAGQVARAAGSTQISPQIPPQIPQSLVISRTSTPNAPLHATHSSLLSTHSSPLWTNRLSSALLANQIRFDCFWGYPPENVPKMCQIVPKSFSTPSFSTTDH